MITTSEFADQLGRKNIAAACDVSLAAVSNCVKRGVFPASWYLACDTLAGDRGLECPPELFGMKVPQGRGLNHSHMVNQTRRRKVLAEDHGETSRAAR